MHEMITIIFIRINYSWFDRTQNIFMLLYVFLTCSNPEPEERLPNIIWCREPFFEELNEIEALNDIEY